MKNSKTEIVPVAVAGLFACSTIILGALYFDTTQNLNSYKKEYSSTIQQYNDLVVEYNKICEALEKAGTTSSPSSQKLLENGHFVAGEDFPAGTYDIEAVSGLGSVYSDNILSGGISAMMGVPSEDEFGIAERKYSNVSLPEGTTLSVDGVKIRIKKVSE